MADRSKWIICSKCHEEFYAESAKICPDCRRYAYNHKFYIQAKLKKDHWHHDKFMPGCPVCELKYEHQAN